MKQLSEANDSAPDDEFLEAFKAALQADENGEAVYGWMLEGHVALQLEPVVIANPA